MDDLSIPLQEDTVEYHVFLPGASQSQLDSLAEEANAYLQQNFIKDYIWQDEPFKLRVSSVANRRLRPLEPQQVKIGKKFEASYAEPNHLVGQTRFGDNIDDEWFIVFLLFELSKKFENICINVFDNDGQFLLIESALALPAWLDVETSTNRIWIHQGKLCIIPPSEQYIARAESGGPVPPLPQLQLENAIQRVCADAKACLAPAEVFSIIQKRLKGFPEKAHADNAHWTRCTVPLKVARLLEADPSIVADAVRGFYHRDPISLKESVKLRSLGPHQPQVNMMVRFSRCLYAQLLRQEFYPPLAFGNRPKPSGQQKSREHDSWLLGSKLAVGLEIAYAEVRSKRLRRLASSFIQSTPDSVMTPLYPFDEDEDWINYKRQITQLGYFQSQAEGTPLYRSLEKKAKLKFLTTADSKMVSLLAQAGPEAIKHFENDDYTDQKYLCVRVDEILGRTTEESAQQVQARMKLFDDSSDEWLNISPAELDEIIATRQGKDSAVREELQTRTAPKPKKEKPPAASDDEESGAEEDGMVFDEMVRDMRKFMQGMSGVDGVGDQDDDPLASVGPMDPKKFADMMRKTLGEQGIDVDQRLGANEDEDDDFYAMGSDDEEDEDGDIDGEELSKESMRKLMKQMERELDSHGLRDEFERLDLNAGKSKKAASTASTGAASSSSSSALPTEDADAPIDLNLNLVKNFLESYGAQHGLAGPVSNILGDMRTSKAKK